MNDKIDIELAEDEDLARAKAWWKDNGSSIISGVVIGTILVFGYNYWQTYQDNHAREVSQLYEEYSTSSGNSAALDSLLEADDGAVYAQLARMASAKKASDSEDFDLAAELLSSVLESNTDEGLQSVATLRLVTVYLASGKVDPALELLEGSTDTERPFMQARVAELKGDIYLQQGDTEKAKSSYVSSVDLLRKTGQPFQLVQLKLDNL